MEGASELTGRKRKIDTSACFNPCFNGRSFRTDERIGQSLRKLSVSILVLMEGASELGGWFFPRLSLHCFNPCFNGRSFRTDSRLLKATTHKAVSILVLMEGASEQILLIYLTEPLTEFQSLF